MPHFAFIVAAGVAIAAFVTIKQQERKSKGPAVVFDQIILFGDSITQQSFQYGGLGSQMANAYQRKL